LNEEKFNMICCRQACKDFLEHPLVGKLLTFVTSGFGLGFLPIAPGSFGALLGIPIFLLTWNFSWWLQTVLFLLFFLIAVGLSEREERISQIHDPSYAVLDEVLGMWVTLLFLWRTDWAVIFVGFLLFRAFDVIKFFPLNLFEGFRGGMGIVMDDLAAGMLANLALRLIVLGGLV